MIHNTATIFVTGIICFMIGTSIGKILENSDWASDCEQMNVHRYGSNVYTCAPKETKK